MALMPDEALPPFRYHPDPVRTGSVAADPDSPCLACNRLRGYIYTGPAWTGKNFNLTNAVCPWCIADGSAAKQFSAIFNDTGQIDGISQEIRDEIEKRTPGFDGWQQERWLACCSDGASFLGVVGAAELKRDFPDAIPVVRKYLRSEFDLSKEEAEETFEALTKDDQPSAYLFRCLHCGHYLVYADET